MQSMKISIVIPAFNEERLIEDTLASVREGMAELSRRGIESELIVCDNNSTDRTAEIARAAGAKVVFEPVNQIARARNCGAAAAGGDWLIFVDADSNPRQGIVRRSGGTDCCGTVHCRRRHRQAGRGTSGNGPRSIHLELDQPRVPAGLRDRSYFAMQRHFARWVVSAANCSLPRKST